MTDCEYDWNYVATHFNFASANEAKDNMGKRFSSVINAYPDNAAVVDGEFITTKYDNYSVMKYNLSTSTSPSGDDPGIYREGKQSRCYRAGWVSRLTKFDLAGMAKAYGEPLIGVSAIAQNLRATSGPLSGALVRRLSTDVLGRGDAVTVANTKYQSGPLPSAFLTDEERDIKRDFGVLKKFPGAIEMLKSALAGADAESLICQRSPERPGAERLWLTRAAGIRNVK
jgi:hypothetical protein